MEYSLDINGFEIQARYDDATVRDVLLPYLHTLAALQRQRGRRLIAFLAAPPGAGKSTLAAFLQRLAGEQADLPPMQALGMDGFHYPQRYIAAHTVTRDGAEYPMQRFKGAPDTFDVARLRQALTALYKDTAKWPQYDRRLHDVSSQMLTVTAPIALVEGNYLLLDDPLWRDLPHDHAVFLQAEEELLCPRLIARKQRGGASEAEAIAHYIACDQPNVRLCLAHSRPADAVWRMTADAHIEALTSQEEKV